MKNISGTRKKMIVAGSSLSLFCYTMPQMLRKVNTQNVLTFLKQQSALTTAFVSAVAASSLIYYYIQTTSHSARRLESSRKKGISKRKFLKRPEEKYASLKVSELFTWSTLILVLIKAANM